MAALFLILKKYWLNFCAYLQKHGISYWLKWSFVTLLGVEMIQRASLISWVPWFLHKPMLPIVNFLIILAIFLTFNAIFANRRAATVLGLWAMLTFAIVDYMKQFYMHEHLYPWDFFVIPEMVALLPSLKGSIFFVSILALMFIPLTGYLIYILFKQKNEHPLRRLTMFSCSVMFLGMMTSVIRIPVVDNYITRLNYKYDHTANYARSGLFVAFAFNIKSLLHVEGPTAYSAENVKRILKSPTPIQAEKNLSLRPNVIMIMSEAFFDPNQLDLAYSQNPIPHMHALQKIHGESSLVSPSFAGGTCNTEFEVLTGLSLNFFARGTYPYQQHIREKLPSLPHIFKENGYQTIAMHPYHKTFFNRENVYPLLGFDDYISVEDWDEPEYAGKFISDKDVTKKIITTSQELHDPYFIFVVTMQNHQPFTTPHKPDLTIESDNLSPESHDILTGYLAGVHDADQSLLALIKYFENSPSPTIVVFFGDHLPSLGNVYDETKFLKNNKNPFALYTVPALLWSNYKQIPPLQSLSIFYLGGYVLEQAGITPPLHFEFLNGLRQEYPVVSLNIAADKDGNIHQTHALKYSDAEVQNLIQDYWILQHDLLFGEQYLLVPAQ